MSKQNVITYLSDHYAGSVGALELLDHLIPIVETGPLNRDLAALRRDIEADQKTLGELLQSLGSEESVLKNAAAWAAEKAILTKLRPGSSGDGGAGVFEALEVLSLGIEGKACLWRALAAAAQDAEQQTWPVDLHMLQHRAFEQRATVEGWRLCLASSMLRPHAESSC